MNTRAILVTTFLILAITNAYTDREFAVLMDGALQMQTLVSLAKRYKIPMNVAAVEMVKKFTEGYTDNKAFDHAMEVCKFIEYSLGVTETIFTHGDDLLLFCDNLRAYDAKQKHF